MRTTKCAIAPSALRSADYGASLAEDFIAALADFDRLIVDFAEVEIMTPSFTNALVMRLLERLPLSELQQRCIFENRSQHVIRAMNRAVTRYQSGIRLSSQAPAAV